jgi:hypothetical protein
MKLFIGPVLALAVLAAGCSNKDSSTPTTPTACAYTVSSTSQSPSAAGGTFSVNVTKTSGSCTWAASSNASWITFSGPSSGSDTGTLTMIVQSNSSTSSRGGTVTVSWNGGNAQIAVNQAGLSFGDCAYSFAATSLTVPAAGGSSSAALNVTGSGCSWNASTDAAWITITSPTSGTSSTALAFTTQPNPDSTDRAGSIIVSGATGTTRVTVTQSGVTSCVYTLTPSSQAAPAAGGTFSFVATRNTANGCSFSASTTTPWITLTGPTSGLSGATIPYSVAANPGAARAGAINVIWSGGNADVIVTQNGSGSQ